MSSRAEGLQIESNGDDEDLDHLEQPYESHEREVLIAQATDARRQHHPRSAGQALLLCKKGCPADKW